MLYLRKMMLEVNMQQQQKEAADSDDEVDVLDPSLYATPRPVEFDKSSQKNPSYLSPNVLISVEEINAIITASPQPQPQQSIHLKEASSPEHDKQIDREEESPGQVQPVAAISSFQRVYGRMRASIQPADTARQRSITDGHTEAAADTLFSGSIWTLLNLLPGVSKRAGGSGGGAGGGKSAVSEDRIVLTTYSTELEDLSKFYTATNPEEFSVTTTELRCCCYAMLCYIPMYVCMYFTHGTIFIYEEDNSMLKIFNLCMNVYIYLCMYVCMYLYPCSYTHTPLCVSQAASCHVEPSEQFHNGSNDEVHAAGGFEVWLDRGLVHGALHYYYDLPAAAVPHGLRVVVIGADHTYTGQLTYTYTHLLCHELLPHEQRQQRCGQRPTRY